MNAAAPSVASPRPAKRAEADQWCLFLDRDGVINRRVEDGYVCSWSQFDFLPGALQAMPLLARWAPRIVVVTNQQGVAKGAVSAGTLDDLHGRMIQEVEAVGGRLDEVLVCPHLAAAGCPCRKPAPGLAMSWLAENPGVEPSLSVMVGDSPSDMAMATRLRAASGGCVAVGVGDDVGSAPADLRFSDLLDFATSVAGSARLEDRLL